MRWSVHVMCVRRAHGETFVALRGMRPLMRAVGRGVVHRLGRQRMQLYRMIALALAVQGGGIGVFSGGLY